MLDNAIVLVRQPTVVTSEDLWSKVSTGKVKILYSLPTLAYQKEETVFFFLFDTLRLSLWSWMFSVPLIGKSYTIQLEINPVSLLNWCGVCSGFAGFHLTKHSRRASYSVVLWDVKCILMCFFYIAGIVFYQEFEGLALLNIFMFLFG